MNQSINKFNKLSDINVANEITIKDQKIKIDSLTLSIEKLEKNFEGIQEKYNELLRKFHEKETQLETVNRSLISNKSLLKSIGADNQKNVEVLNEQILELKGQKIELSDEMDKLTARIKELETEVSGLQDERKSTIQKVSKLESEIEISKEFNESLQKKLVQKSTEFDNLQYEKLLTDEEVKVLTEINENCQMELEDNLVVLERLQLQIESNKVQQEELQQMKSELDHIKVGQEIIENVHKQEKDKMIQTDKNCQDRIIMTDPVDDIPNMNDISLVNTLTTSLGGIVPQNNLNNKQGLAFTSSPDCVSSDMNKNGRTSNKLKSYLTSNKAKNRSILEEDSDLTRISYTTKAANAPKGHKFPLRVSDASPADFKKPFTQKRQKDVLKRKPKFRKKQQNNLINESKRVSVFSNKSKIDNDDQKILKSIVLLIKKFELFILGLSM